MYSTHFYYSFPCSYLAPNIPRVPIPLSSIFVLFVYVWIWNYWLNMLGSPVDMLLKIVTLHCQYPSTASSSSGRGKKSIANYWEVQPCGDPVQATTVVIDLWLPWACHAQKTGFHNPSLHHWTPTFTKTPLLWCPVSLTPKSVKSASLLQFTAFHLLFGEAHIRSPFSKK